jgi:hypothetical protein
MIYSVLKWLKQNQPDQTEQEDQTQNNQNFQEETIVEAKEIKATLEPIFTQIEIDQAKQQILLKAIFNLILDIENETRLKILYEYEQHYLELIQKYKDEIKFANSIQEDLRRERTQFFTYGLREVCETLKNSGIDNSVASQWIQELVASYTKSLDVSSDLANHQVINTIGKLKEETKQEIKTAQKPKHTTENKSKVDDE